jgi:3'-5' exoribonuclease
MTGTDTAVMRLGDLKHGEEAVCFAALVRKETGTDRHGKPFIKCHFRDRWTSLVAPLWWGNALLTDAESWQECLGYRLQVKGDWTVKYGMQLSLLRVRPATEEDRAEGYDFRNLFESSAYDSDELYRKLRDFIQRWIGDALLRRLVETILDEHAELFKKMPAATNFHHGYTGGLIEHVWSMTRVAGFLADHYAQYYHDLNPPLNKGVIVAATILHDIGKLRELDYHPIDTRYTTEGCLIGHVLIGRDLAREAARQIDGFPAETLMLLEHAILAHHGKRDFGAPVVPQTVEALLVSYVDDLDAKMNIAARHRLLCKTDGDFTDKVYALDNRRLYKGVPVADLGERAILAAPGRATE